ncbi:MAG: Asp-tRNA(Asn)/Glu-tRNA(Gln) amidotransferase subunit GatA [Candidatus Omnitrophica bacterium]|nr:Asp-tRNA(Asn)/Glu-tRNA(Gln) amidotransferase subunit GatA [Candidatus Omnitrophota bacterium]
MQEPHGLTAHQLQKEIKTENLKASDIASSIIKRYEQVEDKVKGFAHFEKDTLIERAKDLDKKNKKSPLYKIPVAIKDNICVKDELTTCSSDILSGFKPPYDATVVTKLKQAGALLVGKSNMDEFAFGSSCETSCYGPTKNPYDLERIPGGSSGGSAALVAADETVLAIGSDTGGSIRQPAALCGVVGMKPTYGRVSRYGLIAFGSSLDQIGPLTKDVTDTAILLNIISGHDPMDSTSVDIPVPDYTKSLTKDIKGLRIGLPKEYFIEGLDKDVKERVDSAIETLKGLEVKFIDISLPHTDYAVSVYYIVGCSEASSNLARFDGVQYGLREESKSLVDMYKRTRAKGFGNEAKRRIILGTYSLSSGYYDAYYLKAQRVRSLIREDFNEAFKKCDLILTPTSPTPAFKLGEKTKDPLQMYLSDIFTIPANLAGIPAVSLPCGYSKKGLPVGLQFMAKAFDEENLIRAAYAYEQSADWKRLKPKL